MGEHSLTRALRELLLARRTAALGTLDEHGGVFVSMVPFAIDSTASELVLHVSSLAAHSGNMQRTPRVSLLVCAAVAFAGIIAFVGLVVPHLMRMIIGPAHAPLMITSILGGALLLAVADLVARTAVPLADLPIGMLTALVGGPFFFWLLRRTRKRSGGWG